MSENNRGSEDVKYVDNLYQETMIIVSCLYLITPFYEQWPDNDFVVS